MTPEPIPTPAYINWNRDGLMDRFWSKVKKGPDCWEWQACRDHGYGRISMPGQGYVYAHRLSWELAYGSIPQNLHICHRCDNPSCVRPDHLFLGTAHDNLKDMYAKDRHVRFRKLDEEKILEIRRLYTKGNTRRHDSAKITGKMLANRFGVSPSTIKDIVSQRTWSKI